MFLESPTKEGKGLQPPFPSDQCLPSTRGATTTFPWGGENLHTVRGRGHQPWLPPGPSHHTPHSPFEISSVLLDMNPFLTAPALCLLPMSSCMIHPSHMTCLMLSLFHIPHWTLLLFKSLFQTLRVPSLESISTPASPLPSELDYFAGSEGKVPHPSSLPCNYGWRVD